MTPEMLRKRQKRTFKLETKVCEYAPEATALYDIGVGPKSEYLNIKKRLPDIRLFGCEPDPRQYSVIKPNFPGTIWPVGISTEPTIPLYLHPDVKQVNCFGFGCEDLKPEPIEAWTLDYFDEECGKPEGIILWMDIEGYELDALKSGLKLLSSGRVTAMNLEVRDEPRAEGWCTADEVEAFLNQMGYIIALEYLNQKTHRDAIYIRRK